MVIPLSDRDRAGERTRFYGLLDRLTDEIGGLRRLADCDGRMIWPRRGVYFFFEPGEFRSGSGVGPRVVRVGTHALKQDSGSTLWGRLAQHRGPISPVAGNHRGSVFRLLVGLALARRNPQIAVPSWAQGSSAPLDVTCHERDLEALVSQVIGDMRVLALPIDDDPSPESLRGFVERNAIALLSDYDRTQVDPPSPTWLGRFCPRNRVSASGLWNSNHVDETVDPSFLDSLEQLIASGRSPSARHSEAPALSPDVPTISSGGHAGRIIVTLRQWPDLDDDELSLRSGVKPRQQVNILCRRLEQQGVLGRFIGSRGKIVNRLTDSKRTPALATTDLSTPVPPARLSPASAMASSRSSGFNVPPSDDTRSTLYIIPCSGRKATGASYTIVGSTLLEELPRELAQRLITARTQIAVDSGLNESTLMPAWCRYAGTFYETARSSLAGALGAGRLPHVLILSGAYGVLRATDPIGTYNMPLDESRWPRGLLEDVIETYALRYGLTRLRAFVSSTTGYAKILRRIDWRRAAIGDALIFSPEASIGAMVKAPRALGEAFVASLDRNPDSSWRSTDGLAMLVWRVARAKSGLKRPGAPAI